MEHEIEKYVGANTKSLLCKLEKQNSRINLLENELKCVNSALNEKLAEVHGLERDLEHLLNQIGHLTQIKSAVIE